jgi:hypothetical protein
MMMMQWLLLVLLMMVIMIYEFVIIKPTIMNHVEITSKWKENKGYFSSFFTFSFSPFVFYSHHLIKV